MKKTLKASLLLTAIVLVGCTTSKVVLSDNNDWYAFTPENDHTSQSLIGLEDWHDTPAGFYGRVARKGDKLFYNGKETKLWGVNNCFADCAPPKEMADKKAAFYKKFGINAMRLHKYADNPAPRGLQSATSFVGMDSAYLDRMDYYVKVLKDNGIYTKLSPTFGVRFGIDDIVRIPFHEEVGALGEDKNRLRAIYGSIYFSEELQDLQMEQTLNVLKHTNPYTGLTYAKDPAIFCVELFNEDSVLWYGSSWTLQQYPTLRERAAKAFSKWLLNKYGDESTWRLAWGAEAILNDTVAIASLRLNEIISIEKVLEANLQVESLEKGTVIPWYYPHTIDSAVQDSAETTLKQRLLDAAVFLVELQNNFYERFIDEVRATGFDGEIVTSNWQAGSTIGHLLNLHSDSQAGIVDRHNYFEGNYKAFETLGKFRDASMLSSPGNGMLSAGFQQVNSIPFMLSEWIHVQPNEWYAEGPAILGAYGWGLQGWDVSYMFQNGDTGGFTHKLGKQAWDAANPAVMGLFPAISRQVRRMDVAESEQTHTLNVHLPSLKKGKQSFIGKVTQQFDTKTLNTDKAGLEALAAVRVAVDFTDDFENTETVKLEDFIDDGTITSATGELRWVTPEEGVTKGGYFTINTEATKAFVGFTSGNTVFDLGDGYRIAPQEGFHVIYLTAKGREETLTSAKEIIVTAMSRVRNTGMKLNADENELLERGDAPLLLEPVKALVNVPFNGVLHILDQDGKAVTMQKSFKKAFGIDGAIDKTPFYLITK